MKEQTNKPILAMVRYAVVVKDGSGNRFVKAWSNGHPTVRICTELLADDIARETALFHSREVAACYFEDALELVKTSYRGTKLCPKPPFKAEVVPVTFRLG